MSGAGPRLASVPVPVMPPQSRSPLAHLLHALNQPLTGLQCSLELAVAGPRPAEQQVRTLREGLELTERMRILVEAIRELADINEEVSDHEDAEAFRFDLLLCETTDGLRPVAEHSGVHLSLVTSGPLAVRADRRRLEALLFRSLDCALSLARTGSDLEISAAPEAHDARLAISWIAGPAPEHSPFSRRELGLIIAQAGWEQLGAQWTHVLADSTRTCTVRLPLVSPSTAH